MPNDTSIAYADWDLLFPTESFKNALHNDYAVVGLILLTFGCFSSFFSRKLYVNEAIVAIIIGLVLGPFMIGVLNPREYLGADYELVLLELSRFAVGLNCLNVGLTLPRNYMWKNRVDMIMMLGPVMTVMFLVASLGVKLILGFSWLNSFILGAILTPTDPVLVGTVLNGGFADRFITAPMKNLLAAESAANDALGFCFLYLPFYIDRISNKFEAVGWFLLKIMFYQIILASVLGFIFGYCVAYFLRVGKAKGYAENNYAVGLFIAMTLATIGIMTRLGVDEIVGCMFAGIGLATDHWFAEIMEESEVIEVLDTILNAIYFTIIGGLVPIAKFSAIGWGHLILLAIWIIFIRRVPCIYALSKFIPSVQSSRDRFFVAWFAPVGAGAILYTQICHELKTSVQEELLAVVLFIICTCIIVQGGSVPLIAKYLDYVDGHVSNPSDSSFDTNTGDSLDKDVSVPPVLVIIDTQETVHE